MIKHLTKFTHFIFDCLLDKYTESKMDRYILKRSRAKAEENKKKEIELDKLIPMDEFTDPYATDEEEEYQLPTKKPKQINDEFSIDDTQNTVSKPAASKSRPKKRKETITATEPNATFRTS